MPSNETRIANALFGALGGRHQALLDELASIYTDLHRHPELSMCEYRTAKIAADHVEALGYQVTREVGVTGVVAVLRNGLRAMVAAAAAWLGVEARQA